MHLHQMAMVETIASEYRHGDLSPTLVSQFIIAGAKEYFIQLIQGSAGMEDIKEQNRALMCLYTR